MNPTKLTGLSSMGLPALAALKMPKPYKKRSMTIHGLLNKKIAGMGQSGKFGLLTGIPKVGQGIIKKP
jgi:hypothetical protein